MSTTTKLKFVLVLLFSCFSISQTFTIKFKPHWPWQGGRQGQQRSFQSQPVQQGIHNRSVFALVDDDDDPAPPPGPPPSWTNDTLDTVIDIDVDPPRPIGTPANKTESIEKDTKEETSWFSRILGKFSSKNLVDGQFEYGIPGLGEVFSAIQAFAYWGPNLVTIDALKSIFERSLEVDRFVLDFDW